MQRRCALIMLLALAAGTTGCATSARRSDGTPNFGTNAWSQATAPPQTILSAKNSTPAPEAESPAKPVGLARYFPGLQRNPTEPTRVATRYRPTWFGLRPNNKAVGTQMYMTDARAALGRTGPEPTSLPVALQVPSDRAVTPTNAEAVRPDPSTRPSANGNDPANPTGKNPLLSGMPDFGGKPAIPEEDEVDPLQPAAEPGTPAAVAGRMSELPAVDPRERPRMDPPKPEGALSSDEKAVKANSPLAEPLETTSYSAGPSTQVTSHSEAPTHPTIVLASPQSAPPKSSPRSRLKHPAKPTPRVTPTSQIKPTPQSETIHAWKRPCLLKSLIHKSCKPTECAHAPAASPQ